ncbi:MAG: 2-oxoacid:acceptor oxidoreductase family protein [Alphaproteobacteria bacterium]|nr:2-oxoacid:acceptor oxidoreductase family protein [Alphaproteobacteria bacterium]
MYRIRFHGRGGQGMKTASRILGAAFFLEGFEVQDAPRYGAERRGAPIFAFVRADRSPILERGVIPNPDLVMVADDTLVGMPQAGVLQGLNAHAVLAIHSTTPAGEWRQRLNTDARIVILPPLFDLLDAAQRVRVSAVIAGAAACLTGRVGRDTLSQAVRTELADLTNTVIKDNINKALQAYDEMNEFKGIAEPQPRTDTPLPTGWITLGLDPATLAAPAIHAAANSVQVRTGLWRTLRPVFDYSHCNRCNWVCGSFCPDGVVSADENGWPRIDYDHCKGCMVCVAQCPKHAIQGMPEGWAAQQTMPTPPSPDRKEAAP